MVWYHARHGSVTRPLQGSKPKLIIPPSVKEVNVRLARPDERRRWDATMAEQHPLGFRGFAGRGLRYVAEYQGCWLALIGWQSGAFKCRPRDPLDRLGGSASSSLACT